MATSRALRWTASKVPKRMQARKQAQTHEAILRSFSTTMFPLIRTLKQPTTSTALAMSNKIAPMNKRGIQIHALAVPNSQWNIHSQNAGNGAGSGFLGLFDEWLSDGSCASAWNIVLKHSGLTSAHVFGGQCDIDADGELSMPPVSSPSVTSLSVPLLSSASVWFSSVLKKRKKKMNKHKLRKLRRKRRYRAKNRKVGY